MKDNNTLRKNITDHVQELTLSQQRIVTMFTETIEEWKLRRGIGGGVCTGEDIRLFHEIEAIKIKIEVLFVEAAFVMDKAKKVL